MNLNNLKAEIIRNGFTIENFADEIGMTRTTLWRRMSEPDSFSLKEIKEISKVLRLTKEEIGEIFFKGKVS